MRYSDRVGVGDKHRGVNSDVLDLPTSCSVYLLVTLHPYAVASHLDAYVCVTAAHRHYQMKAVRMLLLCFVSSSDSQFRTEVRNRYRCRRPCKTTQGTYQALRWGGTRVSTNREGRLAILMPHMKTTVKYTTGHRHERLEVLDPENKRGVRYSKCPDEDSKLSMGIKRHI